MWAAYELFYALDKLLEFPPKEEGEVITISIPPIPKFSSVIEKQVTMQIYREIEFTAKYDGEGKTRKLVWYLAA